MLSYFFSMLAACLPHAEQVLSLARNYKCLGPAPTIIFAELTGAQYESVSFARSCRCVRKEANHVFHRAATAVLRADGGMGASAFARYWIS
jgi:phosphopantothenate synthetase